jgi:geranylgeranyl pyrophosphate synthase
VSVSHGIETLCTVYGLGKKTGNANARLIATAPELLAVTKASWHAIQSLLAVREGITDEALHDLAKILDFTIRRAEGKSS